ncbi:MAG: low molecular weight phosphotyrosine protein phosphatase [Firmicutes bacterium]|nr:low molecular weight phosphotyrosine protein phosphatase [Bacillota bacterium]
MIKILFICHGNICRSPMAEYILKDMVKKRHLEDRFCIASVATSREEIGNDVHRGTRRKLAEEGIACPSRQARQVTKADYADFDYLLIMDENNRRNLLRILGGDPEHKIHGMLDWSERPREIADPWYTGNFDITYDDIVEGCETFLRHLKENGELYI